MQTIRDFMYYSMDDNFTPIEIWDCEKEETIFIGDYMDMPKEYDDLEVGSWNLCTVNNEHGICFNI